MRRIKILFLVLMGFVALNTQAQFKVGLTVGPQIPMGDFGDAYNIGFGGNVVGKYMLNDNMAIGLNIGYNSFGSDVDGVSSSMMPITALYEYHFGENEFKPYIGADLGLYNYSWKMEIDMPFVGKTKIDDSKMYFGFAPTAGVLYGLSDKFGLCGNVKYHIITTEGSSSSFLGINVGGIFSF